MTPWLCLKSGHVRSDLPERVGKERGLLVTKQQASDCGKGSAHGYIVIGEETVEACICG
jgi:hypothetical protein